MNSRRHRSTFRKFKTALLCIGFALSCLVTCQENTPPGSTGIHGLKQSNKPGVANAIRVKDGNGVTLSVRKPVSRIIVEYMDNAELIRILGQTDKVVGVAGYDYIFEKCHRQFPELKKKPSVGHPWAPDYEAILGLAPDLLLTFNAETHEKKANLPNVDVLFLGLYYPDLTAPAPSRFIQGVRNLGRILDARGPAEDFIQWRNAILKQISEKAAGLAPHQKPKVLISSYPQCHSVGSVYCVSAAQDTLTQASVIAGGDNLVNRLPPTKARSPFLPVESEWLMAEDPDIIILHAVDAVDQYGYETDDIRGVRQGLQQWKSRVEMKTLRAVQADMVFIFDGHFRNDASGGVLAAAFMAKIFHPELFRDLDPEAIHKEYLAMQHLEYDLDQHGIFVYPPIIAGNRLIGIPDRYKNERF